MPHKDPVKAKEYRKQHYWNNRELYRQKALEWKEKNKARHLAGVVEWNRTNHDARLAITRRRNLRMRGISQDQYDAMLERQNGRCSICKTDNPRSSRQGIWCIDHDHATGEIRGLLCMPCNIKLGWYESIRNRIGDFTNYLERKEAV